MSGKPHIRPVFYREARDAVGRWHSHHRGHRGQLFAVGLDRGGAGRRVRGRPPRGAVVRPHGGVRGDPAGHRPGRAPVRRQPAPGRREACEALATRLEPLWEGAELGIKKLTGDEIERALLKQFEHVPQIMAWNEPRSGHDRPFVACSRYDEPPPDDDIIDLGALARNVKHTLLLERGYDDEGNPTADAPKLDSADRPTTV